MTKHLERDLDCLQRDILTLAAAVEEAIYKWRWTSAAWPPF
jgi:hypothetical protein